MSKLHLTDIQYLSLMKRIRKSLDKIEKIDADDCTIIGMKHTIVNVGLCAKGFTTRDTAMWPEDFDKIGKTKYPYPQQTSMKYREEKHRCPLDKRKIGNFGWGCFYSCRAFQDKNLILNEVKRLYDETIDNFEKKLLL